MKKFLAKSEDSEIELCLLPRSQFVVFFGKAAVRGREI